MLAKASAPQTPSTSPSERAVLEAWPSRDEGPAQIKKFMQQMIEAEPDFDWRITTIADDSSTVAAEWTWTATFTGDTPIGHVVGYHTSGRGASVAVLLENVEMSEERR